MQVLSGTTRLCQVLGGTAAGYSQAQQGTTRHSQVLPPVAEAKVWDEVMTLMNRGVSATSNVFKMHKRLLKWKFKKQNLPKAS